MSDHATFGWSYKQMDYISYGLLILMPKWRKDSVFNKVSIYYNEKNFNRKVREYSKISNGKKLE